MSFPRASICVPVYNTAPYIRQCIESVLAQDSNDWVLLVADNCSTDGTWEILQEFRDSRIKLFRHERNIGVMNNWNFVREKVETDYFCMLGSDDFLFPNFVRSKVCLLDCYPEAPLAYSWAVHVDQNSKVIPRLSDDAPSVLSKPPIEPSSEALKRMLLYCYINISNVMFRRSALATRGITFDSRWRFCGDWAIYVELALFYPYLLLDPEKGASYRFHLSNDTAQNKHSFEWAMEQQLHLLTSFEEHPGEWASHGIDIGAESQRRTAHLWMIALQQLKRGQFSNASAAWALYRRFHPAQSALRDFVKLLGNRLTPGRRERIIHSADS